jgi:hypothetical protein
MTIDAYSAEEHQRVIDAEQRYGDYYVNAYNATIMLSNIMMWPVSDCDIIIRFLSQLKKYPTLSLYWLRVSSRVGSTGKVLKMWNPGTIA